MLTKLIEQMLEAARRTGAVQRRKLRSGLHITIFPKSTTWTLIIWQDKVYPSEMEWKTILKYWPYAVPDIKPEQRFVRQTYTLRAEIPIQKVTQQRLIE